MTVLNLKRQTFGRKARQHTTLGLRKFCEKQNFANPYRYRKPYDDTTNIKLTDMERTILDTITDRLTTKPTSQHNEVLFFTTAHFLFFVLS